MKIEEIHLAIKKNQSVKINFTKLSDDAINELSGFMNGQLQKTYDEYDAVIKAVTTYNKKVETTQTKFKDIERSSYLKASNDITAKAKELGIAPSDVIGLVELDKKYFIVKGYVNNLKTI